MPGLSLSSLTARLIQKNEKALDWDTRACKRLLYAILERAIMDLVHDHRLYRPVYYDPRGRNNKASMSARNALQWIMNETDHQLPSYNAVCRYLHLDPSLLRNPKTLAKVIHYYASHKADRE